MTEIELNGQTLEAAKVWEFAREALNPKARFRITLSADARERIQKASAFVQKITAGSKAVYGINTGFGKFASVCIEKSHLLELQRNLIVSHSCGTGEPLTRDLTMAMWILRLNTLCRGNSGARLETVEKIIASLERGLLSEVPSRGSVGASGDLAPSAHATLALLGEGFCTVPTEQGFERLPAAEALKRLNLKPLELGAKEGLALINGTQLTTALALKAWAEGVNLLHGANLACALSVEALRGTRTFVNEHILEGRRHPGALHCGKEIAQWLGSDSEIAQSHADCNRVQDPYSLRCAPQVHGAIWEDLERAREVIEREMNSSTDNPLLFPAESLSLSGGNFHALYTARVNDMLCSAFATLASISERRTSLLMKPESSHLPTFLIKNGGLHSGLMMVHVTAAALVSEAKSLSFPASVDSIPTNADQEDHVSMGPTAGFKALQALECLRGVLAVELFAATQGIHLLRPLKTSPQLEEICALIALEVAPIERDRVFAPDIERLKVFVSRTNKEFHEASRSSGSARSPKKLSQLGH